MLRLVDAPRCPYCARVRIALAEKGIAHEAVVIDLEDRPAWVYELNPTGRVPVLESDGWALPESAVINEFLEERYPEPPLLPPTPTHVPPRGCVSSGTTTSRSPTTRCGAGRTAPRRRSRRRWPTSTRRSPGRPSSPVRHSVSPTSRSCPG